MTIMNNALSGALAAQLALSASSQNIANLQTKGYTRQAAHLAARGGQGTNSAGNGVEVTQLLRFSDSYKNQQMWRAASNLGAYSRTQPYLTQLERVMGDPAASLSSGIDEFFASLNAVAGVDPTSDSVRGQVLTAASLMAERFNNLNNVLNSQLQSVRQQRSAIVDSANVKVTAIASLNLKISNANATGTSASALIDARDLAIDELAGMMALEVTDQPDGTRNVSLKTGQALVLGGIAGTLEATGGIGSVPQVFTLEVAGTKFALDAAALGGQLGGLTAFEENILVPVRGNVAELAKEIADRVNTQLRAGRTMGGADGTDMFVYTAGSDSNMLKLVAGFKTADLAFAFKPVPPAVDEPGDVSNLEQILAIKNQTITLTGVGSVLLGDADTRIVGKLGVDSQQNKGSLSTAETVRNQAVQDWQSTSGVNQDEEAVNLVEYQKMYQANMKVMSVAMTLFDSTLAMMG